MRPFRLISQYEQLVYRLAREAVYIQGGMRAGIQTLFSEQTKLAPYIGPELRALQNLYPALAAVKCTMDYHECLSNLINGNLITENEYRKFKYCADCAVFGYSVEHRFEPIKRLCRAKLCQNCEGRRFVKTVRSVANQNKTIVPLQIIENNFVDTSLDLVAREVGLTERDLKRSSRKRFRGHPATVVRQYFRRSLSNSVPVWVGRLLVLTSINTPLTTQAEIATVKADAYKLLVNKLSYYPLWYFSPVDFVETYRQTKRLRSTGTFHF